MASAKKALTGSSDPVSYTHLDVYKRQGEDGASHQCNEDIALMRVIPGMTIINPSDDVEAKAAVKAAYEMEGPVYQMCIRDRMKRVGNLSLSISLEGFEDTNDARRGEGVYDKVMKAMDLLHENGLIFGNSICYTKNNIDAVTSDEFYDMLIEHGSRFAWYFHLMPVGMDATPELMPTKEQREYMYHRLREVRGFEGGKEIFVMDFQNDGEYVGGCIAGGRNYCHINPKGDVEPCVFIHYSGANIREKSLLECLQQPLFMAYRDNQPFNDNMLRPCPMLENPEILERIVNETGAHSTDVKEEEPVEHLCGKCVAYAEDWKETADRLWKEHPRQQKGYVNYKKK